MNAFINKCATLVFLLSTIAWAQTESSKLLDRACGPNDAKFSVHEGGPSPSFSGLSKSKARIIVFSEAISLATGCKFTTRVGMDGKWIGATCAGSYASTDVDPGEHHLCTNLSSKKAAKYTALYSFTAEPGRVYYFRAQIIDTISFVNSTFAMHLEPINEDEGRLLLAIRPSSESRLK